jgi:hypothetical protein
MAVAELIEKSALSSENQVMQNYSMHFVGGRALGHYVEMLTTLAIKENDLQERIYIWL